MDVKYIKIDELKPSEYNPRALSEKEEKELMESILRFGMVEPIVVNEAENRKNVIIGGHQRFYICKKLGWQEIPVVYVNIPDIEKEKELNLRLNKNLGHWDWDLLNQFDTTLLLDVGFDEFELDQKLFDIEKIEKMEGDFEYPFGTINSWVRVGDFTCEIEDDKYQKIKKRIEDAGGLENFLNQIIND